MIEEQSTGREAMFRGRCRITESLLVTATIPAEIPPAHFSSLQRIREEKKIAEWGGRGGHRRATLKVHRLTFTYSCALFDVRCVSGTFSLILSFPWSQVEPITQVQWPVPAVLIPLSRIRGRFFHSAWLCLIFVQSEPFDRLPPFPFHCSNLCSFPPVNRAIVISCLGTASVGIQAL